MLLKTFVRFFDQKQATLIYYRGLLETPQKVCGGDILHVMAYQFVFEMPPNRTYNMLHIHLRFFPHFQNPMENGAFQGF